MKKKFTLLLTVLFTLFTLPVSGLTVFAEENESFDDIKDGTYKIKAYAKQAGTNEASTAAGFMSDDATLTVNNGEIELTLFIPENSMMLFKKLVVAGVEPTVTSGELNSEEGKFYTYNISTLQTILNAITTYEVPMINLVHENVNLDFHLEGLDELPKKDPVIEVKTETATETIEYETVEEVDTSLDENETKVKQEGINGTKEVTYEVTYTDGKETDRHIKDETIVEEAINEIILVGENNSSGNENVIIENPDEIEELFYQSELNLDRHFKNPVQLLAKNDKQYIQITGTGGQFISSLMVDGEEADLSDVAEDGTYIMQFEVTKPLTEKLDFKMVIDTGNPNFGLMEHETKIWFTTEENPSEVEVKNETTTEPVAYKTVEEVDSSLIAGETKVKQKGVNGSKKVTYEVTYTDGEETNREIVSEKVTAKPVNEIILVGTKSETIEDGTYNIIVKALHETKDERSGAADFINENATLTFKDGEMYLTIEVLNNDLAVIEGLQVEGLKGEIVVGDTTTSYTFKLSTLSDVLHARIQYAVPSIGLEHDVPFRLVLEGLDALPIQVEVENGTGISNENTNPGSQAKQTSETPDKPAFGSIDHSKDSQVELTGTNANPQTGDTSAIMFYSLLLIGSLIPLAIKMKRRFA